MRIAEHFLHPSALAIVTVAGWPQPAVVAHLPGFGVIVIAEGSTL